MRFLARARILWAGTPASRLVNGDTPTAKAQDELTAAHTQAGTCQQAAATEFDFSTHWPEASKYYAPSAGSVHRR